MIQILVKCPTVRRSKLLWHECASENFIPKCVCPLLICCIKLLFPYLGICYFSEKRCLTLTTFHSLTCVTPTGCRILARCAEHISMCLVHTRDFILRIEIEGA
jgi:hypothetical protein